MQDAAYSANVVPIYRARRTSVDTPALVTLSRHPWREVDVAEALGRSTRTIRRYMTEGLPYQRPFGTRGVLCFAPRDVLAWWAARGQHPAAPGKVLTWRAVGHDATAARYRSRLAGTLDDGAVMRALEAWYSA